ncbi:MAG: tRNA (N6-isopentenyl adenosine(37)-C2)-methylthiotransferase MiaB [Acholeplasmataceae bacterium]
MKDKDLIEKYFKPNLKDARMRKEAILHEEFTLDEAFLGIGEGLKYRIQTYGCQGNEADSEMMAGIFKKMAYTEASDESDADIILINTCAIRENAENRIWGELGRLKSYKRTNPNLILGLCGCMAQEEYVVNKILKSYPYVDLVFGTHNIHKLPYYIKQTMFDRERVIEVYSYEGSIIENMPKVRQHTFKAWVNIMYGCDEFCTYCIVPYTRGKERSRNKDQIIEEVKELVEAGYQEVTLLGQNVNAYGKDFKDLDYTFGDLLMDLDKTGINRIRFTTSHPRDIDDKTVQAFKECKHVMPHLHLPVQSGSNEVLKKMNRGYTKEIYLQSINKLKKARPDISFTTDIIVAFPYETEQDFIQTLDLVKEVGFEGAFTFIFSRRSGTPAYKYPDIISESEQKDRLQRLNEVVNQGYLKGNKRFLGKVVKVLVDGFSKNDENILAGYSEHNKLVNFKGDASMIGKIIDVHILEAKTWFLIGEAV